MVRRILHILCSKDYFAFEIKFIKIILYNFLVKIGLRNKFAKKVNYLFDPIFLSITWVINS